MKKSGDFTFILLLIKVTEIILYAKCLVMFSITK